MGAGFHPAGKTVSPPTRDVGDLCGGIGEIDDEEMDTGEARDMKKVREPGAPTQKEWEEHMILHMPFRAWCPHCVRGRATDEPHKKSDKKGRQGT